MQKNTAGKWIVFAFQDEGGANPGEPVTGDAANITANVRIDGAAANAVDDTNPTELEDGYYIFDLTATETNGDLLLLCPESSTANVNVIGVPGAVWTTPANFNDLGIESDGDLTQVNTCVANTDMRGTDSALLATSAPTNFGDLAITATTGKVTVGTNDDKTGYSISGSKTTLDALNDIAATDIVSAGAITTLSGAVVNVDTVDTCTTNTDMRGTDNALLAASAPTNFADLDITATTGKVTVGTNDDKTGYSISGSKTTLDALNDVAATDIVSAGAITTLSGAVVNVDTVDTCTTNTDMRGTDNAFLAASAPTNFSDLAITVTTGQVTVGTNNDKTGYSISGSKTTLDALNDISTTDVNTEVDTALSDIGLDHLVSVAVTGTDITDNSIIAKMVSSSATADWDTYVNTTDSLQANRDKIDSLNDVAATDIVSGGAITTSGGAVSNVTTVATTTTNTDMRGTDNALLAASAPTNFGDLTITASTGKVTVGTNDDKTGYSISGSKTTLDALNDISTTDVNTEVDTALSDIGLDHLLNTAVVGTDVADNSVFARLVSSAATADWDTYVNTTDSLQANRDKIDSLNDVAATDIVSAGAITTLSGAVVNVDTVDTCTTNTDMRGTDSALLASSAPTNFGDLSISSSTGYVTVGGFLGGTLTETTGGRIAGNFDTFFENADAATTQTVDDVGSGGGGGGDATAANQTTIINHLTDVKGTSFVKDTHSLTDITADVTGINGAAMRGTDSALLAASAPTNFGDLAITATTGKITVGTNDDKTGYSISGSKTTLDALNDISTTDVNTEVDTALTDIGLDHLLSTAVVGADVTDNSIFAKLVSSSVTADWDTYVNTTDSLQANRDKIDSLNDVAATDIVSAGAITTLSGAVVNVDTVDTCTTNTDMRGTDNALLAASAPTNFGDLDITAATGKITVGTNDDKTGYSISGSKTTLDALNDIAATDIVSAGAITTLSGAVVNVDTVDTCTTNTDMRGTDNALLAASAPTNFADLDITATTGKVTVGTNDDKTGYSISGTITTLDALDTAQNTQHTTTQSAISSLNDPSSEDIADAVWDELLTGASHNISTSAGRRLRQIVDVGVYEGGQVWIDTVNGVAGTADYENGTVDNPSDNIADATTLANAVGITRFKIAPNSSFTLATGYTGFNFSGDGKWTLALGGQQLDKTTIIHASISGICTSTNEPHFEHCEINTVTLPNCIVQYSAIKSTITLSSAGDYIFDSCYSGIAGAGTPVIDFGAAVGNTNLNMRHYSGGVEIQNMGQLGTDKMSLEGNGQLIINANCTGGSISLRGNFKVTDNSGGAVTITKDDNSATIETLPSASDIANAVLTAGDVDGYSLEETLKICMAALAGKVSGADTTTITFRAADDSKDRITATVTGNGNRTAITLDTTG